MGIATDWKSRPGTEYPGESPKPRKNLPFVSLVTTGEGPDLPRRQPQPLSGKEGGRDRRGLQRGSLVVPALRRTWDRPPEKYRSAWETGVEGHVGDGLWTPSGTRSRPSSSWSPVVLTDHLRRHPPNRRTHPPLPGSVDDRVYMKGPASFGSPNPFGMRHPWSTSFLGPTTRRPEWVSDTLLGSASKARVGDRSRRHPVVLSPRPPVGRQVPGEDLTCRREGPSCRVDARTPSTRSTRFETESTPTTVLRLRRGLRSTRSAPARPPDTVKTVRGRDWETDPEVDPYNGPGRVPQVRVPRPRPEPVETNLKTGLARRGVGTHTG